MCNPKVVIIAEGVPISEVRKLLAASKRLGKVIIGPATVGGIQAGAFKIGLRSHASLSLDLSFAVDRLIVDEKEIKLT